MKRGFWVIISAVIVVLILVIVFWPKITFELELRQAVTEFKEYVDRPRFGELITKPEFRACLRAKRGGYLFTKTMATGDPTSCEELSSTYLKITCKARIARDAKICEQLTEKEEQDSCIKISLMDVLDAESCVNTNHCFSFTRNESHCLTGSSTCIALATLNYSFFENAFDNCIAEYDLIAALQQATNKCAYNALLNASEMEKCFEAEFEGVV